MKKIKFSLNLGVIDRDNYGNELIIEYLKQMALNSNAHDISIEFLVVFKDVPIKVELFNALNYNHLSDNYSKIKRLDVLINVVDIFSLNSLEDIKFEEFETFNKIYMFHGISILLGVNKDLIEKKIVSNRERITTIDLIRKTKELGFLYCFEIQNKKQDLLELFNKIFDNFILKLGNINPELLKNAISYGKELKKHTNF
ncbi:MAG: hypothetical protein ACFFFB_00445 [Candidatus Heimdallarchaeota archaeon]